MKLNIGKKNPGKRNFNLNIRVSATTRKNWSAILKANPEYKSWELFDLAIESLIKEYGTNES
tara:strand:+ start:50 stop:235 length:186 start_codon:yes stop_codon:yes gene_type:complete